MESKNARFLREGLIEQARKTTPIQRLDAYVDHSRRMLSLKQLGDRRRALTAAPGVPDEG
jgi:hypothetical protein